MPEIGGGLLAVLADPAPGSEQVLENWYEHQHLYERSAIDGFLYSRRYLSVEDQPLSLALYDVTGPAVLHGDAYLGALQNEHKARAAASPEARSRSVNSVRNEYELLESAGRHAGEFGAFIWMVREETDAGHDADLNVWFSQEHLPAIAEVAGVRGVKRYKATVGSPKYLTLYELATADVVKGDAWKKAFQTPLADRVRPHLINVATNLGQFWKVVFPDEAQREVASWS